MSTYTLTDAKNTATVARALSEATEHQAQPHVTFGPLAATLDDNGKWSVYTLAGRGLASRLTTDEAVEIITKTARKA